MTARESGDGTGEAGQEQATLVAAQADIDVLLSIHTRLVAAFNELGSQLLARISSVPLPAWHELQAMARTVEQMDGLLARRFGPPRPGLLGYRESTNRAWRIPSDHAAWRRQADGLAEQIRRAWVPLFFQRVREEKRALFHSEIRALGDKLGPYGNKFLSDSYAGYSAALTGAFEYLLSAAADKLTATFAAAPSMPSGVGQWHDDEVVVAGAGRLRLRVGAARPGPLLITTVRPSLDSSAPQLPYGTPEQAIETEILTVVHPPGDLGLYLDLDRDGGLITDSNEVVSSLTLRLLALVPPGRLTVTVFDPLGLGESASYLYGLGEATEAVIGDKVRTTDRELTDLLLQTEEHITLVTQKYLQGQHTSLTEYNEVAGEVAEAYRLLLLYDFPHGFRRGDGRYDEESWIRLGKIINSGPRCGVFTILISPEMASRASTGPTPKQPARRQLGLPIPSVSSTALTAPAFLPELFAHRAVAQETLATLLGQPVGSVGVLMERTFDLTDKDTTNLVNWKSLAERGKNPYVYAAVGGHWLFLPDPSLSDGAVSNISAAVERGLKSAGEVKVTPARVAELATAKLARSLARGTVDARVVAIPDEPATWWHSRSVDSVTATFGRQGAADVAALTLDSQTSANVLMGGRPGAGKSVWLHAVIASLCQQYPPTELDLYLVDFKEGVEFKIYATGALPHARVVAVESERDFGLSVLSAVDKEISRRGELFRGTNGNEVNLSAFRQRTGEALPRILVIIDEFHVLFERDDRLASDAGEILERIVRQGRAFGIHTILASQTLAGTSGVGRHIFNLIPVRVALQSSDADSRLLLADDNGDARLLTRPGEGIFNAKGGLKDANARFQTAFWDPRDREALVGRLRRMADERGMSRRPAVFEGRAPADLCDLPADFVRQLVVPGGRIGLPVGTPLTLDGPVTAELRREPGGNLLMVAQDDAAHGMLTAGLITLVAAGVRCDVLDFGSADTVWSQTLAVLVDAGTLHVHRGRAARALLEDLAGLCASRRDTDDYTAPARVLVIASLHRGREFDTSSLDGPENGLLEQVLRDGPDVGVHVVAWCDKPASVDRKLTRLALREFGSRILTQASKDDSFQLIDSDAAASLPGAQAVLDDHDRAVTTKLRWFAAADAATIRGLIGAGD